MTKSSVTVLERGTIVFLSQLGHKNFSYPTKTFTSLAEDTPAERLPWTGGGGKIAYAIPAKSVYPEWKSNTKVCVWVERHQPVGLGVINFNGK